MHGTREVIHIEPSSRCTLACTQCPRTTEQGGYDISDCDIPSMAALCKDYRVVIMCGNHGDPIYHPEFHDLIRSIRHTNPSVEIQIHTNGAFRSQCWWEITASLLQKGDQVIFGIDGLPHNNHLYRINSQWDTIETAIEALRSSCHDVTLVWKWIVFKYNQDDIIAGMELSRQLGFNMFVTVYSARYNEDDDLSPVKDRNEMIREIEGWAESHLGAR